MIMRWFQITECDGRHQKSLEMFLLSAQYIATFFQGAYISHIFLAPNATKSLQCCRTQSVRGTRKPIGKRPKKFALSC